MAIYCSAAPDSVGMQMIDNFIMQCILHRLSCKEQQELLREIAQVAVSCMQLPWICILLDENYFVTLDYFVSADTFASVALGCSILLPGLGQFASWIAHT